MKRAGKEIWRLLQSFSEIHLVDRCLLVFFAVFLLQSAYSLFTGGVAGAEAEHVDIIIRTSLAGIFGYFLSGNFIRRTDESSDFRISEETGPLSSQSMEEENPEAAGNSKKPDPEVQILIAAGIGLFCLAVLLVYRNMNMAVSAAGGGTSAAAAQLRDFVSGCVGFLIGSPTGGEGNN